MAEYKYQISDCDVRDKATLEVYRAKRAEWVRLLDGDPVHSISSQLSAMLWNDIAFRVFNEARRFASEDNPNSAVASMLAEFLDIGYVATQVLAIGRVAEKSPSDPNKSVISLRRILDEMVENRSLITREHYVAYDGLPYDPAPVREKHHRQKLISANRGASIEWRPTSGPDAWEVSDRMHETFDRLSNKTADSRSMGDLISIDVYKRMIGAFDDPVFDDIKMLRHKILAHASDQTNRPANFTQLTLDMSARAHKILSRVAHTVSGTILYHSGAGGLPIPQFDQFKFLDRVFIASENLKGLNEFWWKHASMCEAWLQDAEEKVLSGRPAD